MTESNNHVELAAEIVSAYVLGAWRQSPAEVRDLVERAADAAERVVSGAEAW